ncbi:MAG: diacylglycerol kinase family protein [Clostridia bacterium]
MIAMIKAIAKSFTFALRGILLCIKNERNFRIHIIAIIYVTTFAVFYGLDRYSFMILFLLFGCMIFAEAVNTAIETVVNMQTKMYNRFARDAKDMAAGAVLIFAIIAVIFALVMFSDPVKLMNIVTVMKENIIIPIVLLISIVPSVLFIKK